MHEFHAFAATRLCSNAAYHGRDRQMMFRGTRFQAIAPAAISATPAS